MPFIKVEIAGELNGEQKREIARQITDTMENVAGKARSYTYVVINEISRENWAIAGDLLAANGSK